MTAADSDDTLPGSGRDRATSRIEVLRAVRVSGPALATPVAVTGRIDRCLLTSLAVHRGRAVDAAHLEARVWGEDPAEHAPGQLRRAVRDLVRTTAGAGVAVVGDGSWFGLDMPPGSTDLDGFRRAVATGRRLVARGRTHRAAEVLSGAVDLWAPTSPLLGTETDAWPEALELREERLNAVEDHAGVLVDAGRSGEAADRLACEARANPLRESLAALRVRALVHLGRDAEALDVYEQTGRRLAETLGLDPGPDLVREAARARGGRSMGPAGARAAAG